MSRRFELVAAGEARPARLFEFLVASFGGRKGEFLHEHGDWLHRGPENRLALLDGDRVVGYCGFIPTRFLLDGRARSAIWWMDLVIDPEFRGQGLQRFFDDAARERSEFKLGFPNQVAAAIHRRHGWGVHRRLDISLASLDSRAFVRLGQGSPLKGAAFKALAVVARPVMLRFRDRLQDGRTKATYLSGTEMMKPLASLFEAHSSAGLTTTLRDAEYLGWRYGSSPFRDEYGAFLSERGEVAMIVRILPSSSGPRVRIVDIFGDLTAGEALGDTLRSVMSWAVQNGASEVKTMTSLAEFRGPLRRSGFWLRSPGRFCWYSREIELMRRFSESPQHWVMSDSDNDEPS